MKGENVCLPDSQEKSDGGWVQLRTNKRTLIFKMLLIFHIVHVATSMALSNVHNMHLLPTSIYFLDILLDAKNDILSTPSMYIVPF